MRVSNEAAEWLIYRCLYANVAKATANPHMSAANLHFSYGERPFPRKNNGVNLSVHAESVCALECFLLTYPQDVYARGGFHVGKKSAIEAHYPRAGLALAGFKTGWPTGVDTSMP